jgi:hypothetical protein
LKLGIDLAQKTALFQFFVTTNEISQTRERLRAQLGYFARLLPCAHELPILSLHERIKYLDLHPEKIGEEFTQLLKDTPNISRVLIFADCFGDDKSHVVVPAGSGKVLALAQENAVRVKIIVLNENLFDNYVTTGIRRSFTQ